jgi:hypothetical protein
LTSRWPLYLAGGIFFSRTPLFSSRLVFFWRFLLALVWFFLRLPRAQGLLLWVFFPTLFKAIILLAVGWEQKRCF